MTYWQSVGLQVLIAMFLLSSVCLYAHWRVLKTVKEGEFFNPTFWDCTIMVMLSALWTIAFWHLIFTAPFLLFPTAVCTLYMAYEAMHRGR